MDNKRHIMPSPDSPSESDFKRRRLYVKTSNIANKDDRNLIIFPLSAQTSFPDISFEFNETLTPSSSECMKWIIQSLLSDDDTIEPARLSNAPQRMAIVNLDQNIDSNQSLVEVDKPAPSILSELIIPWSNNKEQRQSVIGLASEPKALKQDKQQTANWSVDEDALLVEMHGQCGNSWAVIASFLPGRSRIDVKSRYRSICRAAKRYWTLEQDKMLLQAYVQFGNQWSDEMLSLFPEKKKNSIKRRLNDLLSRPEDTDPIPIGSPCLLFNSRPEVIPTLLTSLASYSSFKSLTESTIIDEQEDDIF